jgi:hypothetical protein
MTPEHRPVDVDPMTLPYEVLRHFSEKAAELALAEWQEDNPGRQPTKPEAKAIARGAGAELEAAIPGFFRVFVARKAIAFAEAELRAWQAAHPDHQGEPPEAERARMVRDAWLLARTGREPGIMT